MKKFATGRSFLGKLIEIFTLVSAWAFFWRALRLDLEETLEIRRPPSIMLLAAAVRESTRKGLADGLQCEAEGREWTSDYNRLISWVQDERRLHATLLITVKFIQAALRQPSTRSLPSVHKKPAPQGIPGNHSEPTRGKMKQDEQDDKLGYQKPRRAKWYVQEADIFTETCQHQPRLQSIAAEILTFSKRQRGKQIESNWLSAKCRFTFWLSHQCFRPLVFVFFFFLLLLLLRLLLLCISVLLFFLFCVVCVLYCAFSLLLCRCHLCHRQSLWRRRQRHSKQERGNRRQSIEDRR